MSVAFLQDEKEIGEFGARWQPRRVIEAPHFAWPFVPPRPEDLEEAVRRVVNRMQAESTNRSALIGVAVEVRDGRSWSATKARQTIEAHLASSWEIHCVWSYEGQSDRAFSQLLDLIGGGKHAKRAIRRAAGESEFVPDLKRPWAWWFIGLMVCTLLATMGAALAKAGSAGGAPALLWASIAVAPSLSVLARAFTPQITPISPGEATRKVKAQLREEMANTDEEREFLRLMLAELTAKQPRVVIVEGFGDLSPMPRKLVERYLAQLSKPRPKELWLLFSRGRRAGRPMRADGQPLNTPDLLLLTIDEQVDKWFCRQAPLTHEEKVELLQLHGHREPSRSSARLRQHSVGHVMSVARAEQDRDVDISEELKDLRMPQVCAFALLAAAAAVPDPAGFRRAELASLAREANRDAELKKLLLGWFPEGSRSPTAIEEALKGIEGECSALLEKDQSSSGAMRVIQFYADAFRSEQTWRQYELPAEDMAHVFWALYWHAQLQKTRSAPVAERLSMHLRCIREPARVRGVHGRKVVDRLFDAAADAVECALAMCVEGIAPTALDYGAASCPGLFEQAHLLLAVEHGTPDRRRQMRLLNLAWVVYMLTGETAITETISAINLDLAGEPAAQEDPLGNVYLETIPRYASLVAGASSRVGNLAAAVSDHARARGAWIIAILTLQDQLQWLMPVFPEAQDAVSAELPAAADRALRRLQAGGDDNIAALDLLTLTHVLLHDALSILSGSYEEGHAARLGEIQALVTDRIQSRESSSSQTNFVLDGLLHQVDATAHATAALVAADGERRSVVQFEEALRRLYGLHVMWHNMELYGLSDLAIVARGGLVAMAGAPTQHDVDADGSSDHLVGLSADDADAARVVEAALLAAGTTGRRNTAIAQLALVRAASAAIEAILGSDLTLALCATVLSIPNAPSVAAVDRIVEYVIDQSTRNGGGVLDPSYGRFTDAVLGILRCLTSADSALALRAQELVWAKRELLSSEWDKDVVSQHLEKFVAFRNGAPDDADELADLLERWRKRARTYAQKEQHAGLTSPPLAYRKYTHRSYAYFLSYVWSAVDNSHNTILADTVRRLEDHLSPPDHSEVALALKLGVHIDQALRRSDPSVDRRLAPASEPARKSSVGATTGQLAASLSYGPQRDDRATATSASAALRLAVKILLAGLDAEAHAIWPLANRYGYELLARQDSGKASAHRAAADYWRAQDELIAQESMFKEADKGRHLAVFIHHHERVYELPHDCSHDQLTQEMVGPLDQLWDISEGIPDPIIYGEDGLPVAISCDFLRAGYYLTYMVSSSPIEVYEEAYAFINKKAEDHIHELYRILIDRTKIPEPLREILRRQRARFDQE